MSGTVMKFGPQWIRTLTDGAAPSPAANQTSTSSSTPFSNNNNNNNNAQINSNSATSTSSTLSSSAAVNSYYNNNPSLYNSSSNNGNNSANNNTNTSGNNNSSSSSNTSKYKLAEYRYGREEMLALFEPNMEAPEDIKNFASLYVKDARMPMAMTQLSEEEVKLGTRTWNSEAVLRSSSGKLAAAAAAGGGGTAVASSGNTNHAGGISSAGGSHGSLGSSMNDRDSRQMSERGAMTAAEVLSSSPRGPPGAMSRVPLGEQRGLLSSIGSRGPTSTIRSLVGRGANIYLRSQSHDDEGIGSGDGISAGSASAGISGTGPGNYESRFGLSGQPRQPSSLRARFDNSRSAAVPGVASSKPIDIKAGIDSELPPQGRSVFDRLPTKYNAEDKLIRKDINGRPLPSDWRSREWSASGGPESTRPPKGMGGPQGEDRSWRSARSGGAQTAEDWRSGSGQNVNSGPGTAQSSSWYVRSDDQRNPRQHLPQNQENLNPSGKRDTLRRPSADEKHGDDDDNAISIQPRHRRDSLPEWSIGDPLSGDKVGSFDASGAFREMPRDDGGNSLNNKMKAPEKHQHQHQHQEQQHQQQQNNQSKRQHDHQKEQSQGNDFEHLERAAEIMVEKWTAEEEQHERKSSSSPDFLGNKSNSNSREQHDAQHANTMQNNSIDNRKSSQVQHHRQEQQQHQVGSEQGVGNSGSAFDSVNNQQKLILLPSNHENAQQWFYRDTQSVIQGPFSANDMYEWYKAGYFVEELLVRRACDELFYPLGDVIKMWDRIPFAPMPMNVGSPPPITAQTILQFRAIAKRLEMAATQGRLPPNAFDVTHPGAVLLHGPLIQQQQPIHPVLAAASMNQSALAPPEQQANIRQIIEAATRQQQQRQQQHEPTIIQQQQQQQQQHQQQQHRNVPVNVPDQNEMQAQLRQLLVQLKNREGFSNLNAQEQQEVLVRQFVASRAMTQNNAGNGNNTSLQEQEHQALLQQQHRAGMVPFMPSFLSNDQQERIRYQQEFERRQKEEAEKQQQQSRLIMEQRMKVEEEKQRLIEEVQKQRQRKQIEENEKQKQEAEEERIRKLNLLKQQQLAKQHEEFKQQMQNQHRIQMQQQQEKKQQQQQQSQQQQQQQQTQQPQQTNQLSTIQQQQQQQIERAKKAAQAHQVQQEQQQQQRKTAWSTVSKADQEPVSLATLQKLQEEEKEKERERQRQQQAELTQQQQAQQQQQINFQRQLTWANAAQQSKVAPVKTLAEIQKEEEERLAKEKQRKAKVQPVVASAGVWNNAASHLSWKNPPSDS